MPEPRPADTFQGLLMDALKDVVLARQLDEDQNRGRGWDSESNRRLTYIAWDRAAESLRLLRLYCEQQRDA